MNGTKTEVALPDPTIDLGWNEWRGGEFVKVVALRFLELTIEDSNS